MIKVGQFIIEDSVIANLESMIARLESMIDNFGVNHSKQQLDNWDYCTQ
jgi:hypothetical protein